MGLSRKQIMMLSVLIFGTFVTILNQTIVAPALPSIMTEMQVDATTAQWLTTGFTLVNAIMIPITAYFTDRFSTRNLFLVSMAIFTAGSVLAGWGPSFALLLLGRLIQAVGAGILMPMVMTVLMLLFPVERRGTAMGLFGIVIAFAPAIGPTVAGIIVDQSDWHIMFFIIAVLSAVVMVFALFAMENTPALNKNAVLDKPSVLLSSVGFGCLLYGFSTIGSYGISAGALVVTIVGLVALVFFFRRQLTMETPMLQVRVLANRTFLVGTIIGMLVQAALLAAGILVPIYIQSLCGFPATVSGLILLPGAIIMGIMGPVAGKLFDKYGPRVLSLVGMGILTATTFGFTILSTETSLVYITALYTVRMASLALINMPITTWAMNALDNKVLNHGTSVNNTLRQVAGSLGTAVIISATTMVTNMNTDALGAAPANMLGINIAFALSGVLCLVSLIMVIFLVKPKPGDAAQADPDNARRTILETIMKREVFTVPETATVCDTVRLFVEKGISAAPIVNAAGEAVGFVSDGDVMRFLSKRSKTYMDPIVMIMQTETDDEDFNQKLTSLMNMNVRTIATKSTVGVGAHAGLEEICRVLGENHLKKVPVLEGKRIVGIVNRSDITHYSMKSYLEAQG
ncbi:MAG: MDR family MFS transporter [Raoultibacter sp.]